MQPLPLMPMLSKRLAFRRRNPRKKPHLQHRCARIDLRLALNRVSAITTKEALNALPARRCIILVELESALGVLDFDLRARNREISGRVGTADFAAVAAVADVAAALGEQLGVVNGDVDAAAEAGGAHAGAEFGDVVVVGVASELVGKG